MPGNYFIEFLKNENVLAFKYIMYSAGLIAKQPDETRARGLPVANPGVWMLSRKHELED
jgi:hypothetical protein